MVAPPTAAPSSRTTVTRNLRSSQIAYVAPIAGAPTRSPAKAHLWRCVWLYGHWSSAECSYRADSLAVADSTKGTRSPKMGQHYGRHEHSIHATLHPRQSTSSHHDRGVLRDGRNVFGSLHGTRHHVEGQHGGNRIHNERIHVLAPPSKLARSSPRRLEHYYTVFTITCKNIIQHPIAFIGCFHIFISALSTRSGDLLSTYYGVCSRDEVPTANRRRHKQATRPREAHPQRTMRGGLIWLVRARS